MKKKFVAIMMVAAMAASMAACGSDGGSSDTQKGGSSTTTSDVANKDKPLVWFNRQPSNSSTGELDTTALNYNKDTYYVGFDANQGAELQGEMVKEYIEKNIDTIDRNGDGVIGYVLAIGDIGHNDSIARTRGVRKALGTGVDKSGEIDSAPAGTNSDGKAAEVQDGKITVNGKDYVVRELASQEMKNSAGATWDGLFLKGNLTFNTTIANLGSYKNGPALSDSKMTKATSDEIKIMHTKCMGPEDMISALSGGNQQKVIFGKWLERGPQIFMMDEPTRGIDVGAKYEIYELIINMAKQGKTVIVVSSEMPEILGITNRIGVMSNGRLSGIVNTKETNQEELLRLSAKYL